jgi:hypothetical protein
MMWHECKFIMPGERHDAKKNPQNKVSRFLICYHYGDKDVINPDGQIEEAILLDGKFLCKGELSKNWDEAVITHWMLIERP